MEVRIKNLLGVKELEFECCRGVVTELLGVNASGKTSTITALRALLTHEVDPLGMGVSSRKWYANRDSLSEANAVLQDDDTRVEWIPSAQRVVSSGNPLASRESAGVVDFLKMMGSAKKRAEMLSDALMPPWESIREKLDAELQARSVAKEARDVIIDAVRTQGWSAASAIYEDRMRVGKREWQQTTGENYGAKKGAEWTPDGFLSDYFALTTTECGERIREAREALDALHQITAVKEVNQEKLDDARERLSNYNNRLVEVGEEIGKLTRRKKQQDIDLAAASEQLSDKMHKKRGEEAILQQLVDPSLLTCPCCGESNLFIQNGKLALHDKAGTEAKRKYQQNAVDLAVAELTEVECAYTNKRETNRATIDELNMWEERATRLQAGVSEMNRVIKENEQNGSSGGLSQQELVRKIVAEEERLDRAKDVLAKVTAYLKARELHESIDNHRQIADLLSPSGVRLELLSLELAAMNGRLTGLNHDADGRFGQVVIERDGLILYNGAPLQSASGSEQWRAQAVIQIAFALANENTFVLLDEGDILDELNYRSVASALKKVCERYDLCVVIARTASTYGDHADGTRWKYVEVSSIG